MSGNQGTQMREVLDLLLADNAPVKAIWNPIFEKAALIGVKMLAYKNVGGAYTLTIPVELKPFFATKELRYPATQSFNERFLIFA